MWNVKNLDYKNASSETVTNSRTFTKPANYTYLHERARALSKFPQHLGNDSSLWRDFRQDESRAKCYAIILVAQWDFREVFRPITEFVRASKFHILANKVTRRVFQRDFDFNDPLINSERFFLRKNITWKKEFNFPRAFLSFLSHFWKKNRFHEIWKTKSNSLYNHWNSSLLMRTMKKSMLFRYDLTPLNADILATIRCTHRN